MSFTRQFARALCRGFMQTMPVAIAIVVTAAVMDARSDRPATVAGACAVQTLRSEYRVRSAMADIRDTVRNTARSAAHLEAIEAALAKHRAIPGYWATDVQRGE